MQTVFDTARLNRLERLILTTLPLHPNATQAEIASTVQIVSPWYLRNALRTLTLLGLLTATTDTTPRYSVASTRVVA